MLIVANRILVSVHGNPLTSSASACSQREEIWCTHRQSASSVACKINTITILCFALKSCWCCFIVALSLFYSIWQTKQILPLSSGFSLIFLIFSSVLTRLNLKEIDYTGIVNCYWISIYKKAGLRHTAGIFHKLAAFASVQHFATLLFIYKCNAHKTFD